MRVDVSIGEVIDKYSILEIKLKNIQDEQKIVEIKKEMEALSDCKTIIGKYDFYYRLLVFSNQKIWNMTDDIKKMEFELDPILFARISNEIFEFNQKRFRMKNMFNLLCCSDLKEQKSYISTVCVIYIDTIDTFYQKLCEINYLFLEYDCIVFQTVFENTLVKQIYNTPNIYFDVDGIDISLSKNVNLWDFTICENREIFCFPAIRYIAGGLFGDYIQELSVINEIFLKTGKKGILYISNTVGDPFRNPLEQTYNDTYDVIRQQIYIDSYSIYNNESYDVNLSQWRCSHLLYNSTWYHIFKSTYDVEWGTHPWIVQGIEIDAKLQNRILINISHYRFCASIDFSKLYELYGDRLLFISYNYHDYNYFKDVTGLNIEYYKLTTFYEMCVAIKSCESLVANLSGCLTIGHAMQKKRIIGFTRSVDNIHNINVPTWKNVEYIL
jgi:hypothetical protein